MIVVSFFLVGLVTAVAVGVVAVAAVIAIAVVSGNGGDDALYNK